MDAQDTGATNRGGENRLVFVIGAVVIGYILFLLGTNFASQRSVRQSILEQFRLETTKRAQTVGFQFAERRKDVDELGRSRELDNYFTNKALGMSEQYGLRHSRLQIARKFQEEVNRTAVSGQPLFSRVLFAETDGNILSDATRQADVSPAPLAIASYVDVEDEVRVPRFEVDRDSKNIVIAVPYFFKEAYQGTTIALVALDLPYGEFVRYERTTLPLRDFVMTAAGELIGPADVQAHLPSAVYDVFRSLEDGVPQSFDQNRSSRGGDKLVAVRVPVPGTSLYLLTVRPYQEVFTHEMPPMVTLTLGAMPLVAIIGIAVFARYRHVNLTLRARIDETNRHRQVLAMEVERRRRVEEELREKNRKILDQTEQLQLAMQQAHQLAFYDSLTGLPNRVLFMDRFNTAIERAKRYGWHMALLFLDLDRFKRINDTLGHHIGDELLKSVAERLSRSARRVDTVTRDHEPVDGIVVSRQGGDEFMVLLEKLDNPQDAAHVAIRLINAVSDPLRLRGHEVCITTSVGISLFPNDGYDPDALIKNADLAMYNAKENGANMFRFYRPEMNSAAFRRLSVETDLRKALDRDELLLHFQPQIDLRQNRIVGAEALVRWQHPTKGLVSPGEFIPIAEESGLIIPLTEWVLEQACREAIRWQAIDPSGVRVCVNLSAHHFRKQNVFSTVEDILQRTGLAADRLEVELTESVLMANKDEARRVITQLRELGVFTSLDDFGTGYSSLAYLKDFPITTLKVDVAFVREVTTNPHDAAIVRAILAIGQSLGLDVVIEGVEHYEQLVFLESIGGEIIQGFLFSPPLPAEDHWQLLRSYPDWRRQVHEAHAVGGPDAAYGTVRLGSARVACSRQ